MHKGNISLLLVLPTDGEFIDLVVFGLFGDFSHYDGRMVLT